MKPKEREEMIRKLYIDGGKNEDMENNTGILQNETAQQFEKKKGMQRSLVARLFWVQNVTGSNPVIPTYHFFYGQ